MKAKDNKIVETDNLIGDSKDNKDVEYAVVKTDDGHTALRRVEKAAPKPEEKPEEKEEPEKKEEKPEKAEKK